MVKHVLRCTRCGTRCCVRDDEEPSDLCVSTRRIWLNTNEVLVRVGHGEIACKYEPCRTLLGSALEDDPSTAVLHVRSLCSTPLRIIVVLDLLTPSFLYGTEVRPVIVNAIEGVDEMVTGLSEYKVEVVYLLRFASDVYQRDGPDKNEGRLRSIEKRYQAVGLPPFEFITRKDMNARLARMRRQDFGFYIQVAEDGKSPLVMSGFFGARYEDCIIPLWSLCGGNIKLAAWFIPKFSYNNCINDDDGGKTLLDKITGKEGPEETKQPALEWFTQAGFFLGSFSSTEPFPSHLAFHFASWILQPNWYTLDDLPPSMFDLSRNRSVDHRFEKPLRMEREDVAAQGVDREKLTVASVLNDNAVRLPEHRYVPYEELEEVKKREVLTRRGRYDILKSLNKTELKWYSRFLIVFAIVEVAIFAFVVDKVVTNAPTKIIHDTVECFDIVKSNTFLYNCITLTLVVAHVVSNLILVGKFNSLWTDTIILMQNRCKSHCCTKVKKTKATGFRIVEETEDRLTSWRFGVAEMLYYLSSASLLFALFAIVEDNEAAQKPGYIVIGLLCLMPAGLWIAHLRFASEAASKLP